MFASTCLSIHAPEWERQIWSTLRRQSTILSIHAPEWERLTNTRLELYHTLLSIHAPEWERPIRTPLSKYLDTFQSTLPNGSDTLLFLSEDSDSSFNPRSRMGATAILDYYAVDSTLSIHAPEWERLLHLVGMFTVGGFQSTLPNGSDVSVN